MVDFINHYNCFEIAFLGMILSYISYFMSVITYCV